jgi:hypothetical protein
LQWRLKLEAFLRKASLNAWQKKADARPLKFELKLMQRIRPEAFTKEKTALSHRPDTLTLSGSFCLAPQKETSTLS